MVPLDEQQIVSEPTLYSIEQVATRLGVTKRTLRYYEEVGLLPPTDRTEGNYRRYTQSDLERLERIKELRDLLGFSLADIRTLLEAEDERSQLKEAYRQEHEAPAKLARLAQSDEIIRQQLQLVEQKITGLEQMRAALQGKLTRHEQIRNELQSHL